MLQKANPKFYKEQLMMAKQGIELGARCHNNRERRTRGSCGVALSSCLGRSQGDGGCGMLVTPPTLVGIIVSLV